MKKKMIVVVGVVVFFAVIIWGLKFYTESRWMPDIEAEIDKIDEYYLEILAYEREHEPDSPNYDMDIYHFKWSMGIYLQNISVIYEKLKDETDKKEVYHSLQFRAKTPVFDYCLEGMDSDEIERLHDDIKEAIGYYV